MIRFTFDTKVDVLQVEMLPELLPITWTLLAVRLSAIMHTLHGQQVINHMEPSS